MTLNRLSAGQSGTVSGLLLTGAIRRRLLDLGLIEGTKVRCVRRSLAGNPVIYSFRGAMVALRSEDSARICVEEISAWPSISWMERRSAPFSSRCTAKE